MYTVAIVDDEPVVRKGVISLIDWSSLECTVVHEANDGLELIEKLNGENLDIVITDVKMPRMDGMELARYFYENFPLTKIIMLSAYSEFTYAKQSIQYGVVDYIIKSGGVEEIEKAIDKVKHRLKQQEEVDCSWKESNQVSDVLKITFLKSVMDHSVLETDIICSQAKLLDLNFTNYIVLVLELVNYSFNKKLYSFLDMSFKEIPHYIIKLEESYISMILYKQIDTIFEVNQIVETCRTIITTVNEFMKVNLSIGVSGIYSDITYLSEAYNAARKALHIHFLQEEGNVYYTVELQAASQNPILVNDIMQRIVGSIKYEGEEEVLNEVEALFELQKQQSFPVENLKSQGFMLNTLCSKLLLEMKLSNQSFYDNDIQIYNRMTNCRTFIEYKNIICFIVKRTFDRLHENSLNDNKIVLQANEYISKYFTTPICLNDIANYIHITPGYLSRIYKEKTGVTIISVINHYRIELAKKLLLTSNKTIAEIGSEVGLDDTSYFSRFFKKSTGKSPKDFKNAFKQKKFDN